MQLLGCLGHLYVSVPCFTIQIILISIPSPVCLSFWCPCVTYSRNKHRFDHLNTRGTPNPEQLAFCNTGCALHGLLTFWGFSWVMQVGKKKKRSPIFDTWLIKTLPVYAPREHQGEIQHRRRSFQRLLHCTLVQSLRAYSRIA